MTESVSNAARNAAESVKDTAESLGAAAGFASSAGNDVGGARQENAASKDGETSTTVYVGNLFFDVRGEDLRKEFERAGPVVNTKIIMDQRGLSKGYVFLSHLCTRISPTSRDIDVLTVISTDLVTLSLRLLRLQPKPLNSTTFKISKAVASLFNTASRRTLLNVYELVPPPALAQTAPFTRQQRLSSSATCLSTCLTAT